MRSKSFNFITRPNTYDLATPWSARIANNDTRSVKDLSKVSKLQNCSSIADERGHNRGRVLDALFRSRRRERERDLHVHKQVQVVTKIVMKSVCRTWATIGSCHTRV